MNNFKPYKKVQVNGKHRTIYIKTSSKSNNPIMYIKHKKEMITYKSFLKLKKMRGGGFNINQTILSAIDVTDYTFDQMQDFIKRNPLSNEKGVYHAFEITTSQNKTYKRTYDSLVDKYVLQNNKDMTYTRMIDYLNTNTNEKDNKITQIIYVVAKDN